MHIHHSSPNIGLVATVALMISAMGCAPGAETSDTTASDPDRVSAQSHPSAIASPSANASLPDGFPADFPMPPDFTITEGQFTEGSYSTQANYLVRGTSTASVTAIAEFYHDRLPQAGYEVQQWQPVTPAMTTALVYFHGDRFKDCSVQLASDSGLTSVLISLPLRD